MNKTKNLRINKLALAAKKKQCDITSISKNDMNNKFILQ